MAFAITIEIKGDEPVVINAGTEQGALDYYNAHITARAAGGTIAIPNVTGLLKLAVPVADLGKITVAAV
jgi:hypothetical protein